jgi:isocitrate dehydrogenase (NAD+)
MTAVAPGRALISGDGIGPEIADAVVDVLDALGGNGIANPVALLLASALMIDHAGLVDQARQLPAAIDAVQNQEKVRTGDLGGKASTGDFAKALVQRISSWR